MEITILGTESLGVRGLSCCVETADRTIVIDPGVALGFLREGLFPHPAQVAVGARIREAILAALGRATDVVISHYHGDHIPLKNPTPYQIPLFRMPPLEGVRLWCKSPEGLSAQSVRRHDDLETHIGRPLSPGEGRDDGTIRCSHPVSHGIPSSPFGTVMMTRITDGEEVFIHASDVQLLDSGAVATIFGWHPTILLASGPPLYLPALSPADREMAWNHAAFLAGNISTLILDHHLFRSLDGISWLADLAVATQNRVCCAAEFMGSRPLLLEARRAELYEKMPVPHGWHASYACGEAGYAEYDLFY